MDWWTEPSEHIVRDAKTKATITTLPHRQAVLDYLSPLADPQRCAVEIVHSWRVEYGDYVYDLLAGDKQFEADEAAARSRGADSTEGE